MNTKNLIIGSLAAISLAACSQTNQSAAESADRQICVESFATPNGNTVEIGLINHGSLSVTYADYHIQIDPVGTMDTTINYAAMPKADLILVSHEHADHLDPNAIATLSKDSTLLCLSQRAYDALEYGNVRSNGDTDTLRSDIVVEYVPAYNTTPDHLGFHPQGVGNGFVLNIDGLRIYVAGDTEYIEEMNNLKDIDVAFLPVNQPYTMSIEQAEQAARAINPRVLFPYHYSQTDVNQLAEKLSDTNIDVRIRKM